MSTESTALQLHRSQALVPKWRMAPTSLGEAMEMATLLAGSELCPRAYRGKPQDCIVAYEYGAALGLSWMQALRSISVINGQAALWGDAIPALILGSGECERFHEYYEGEKGTDAYTAVCILKRKGLPDESVVRFSVADAKKAGLWGKQGPWQLYSDRMLCMRARGFNSRGVFADKLSGLIIAEEAMDYPTVEGHVVNSELVETAPAIGVFEQLPEGLRDNIERAFANLNLSPGLRLAKILEFLGAEDSVPEEAAQKLLDWCRDEFAKRKTGQPRAKKGDSNGKSVSAPAQSAPASESGAQPERVESHRADPVAVPADAAPAGGAQPAAASAPAAKAVKATTPELF